MQLADLEESKASGLIEVIGENVDAEYLKEVKGVNINQDLINEYGRDMKIVYTPLHGTGEMLARRALAQAGFEAVQVVEAQAVPDADFSTVKSPNPENQAAFALAEELGRKVDADVLVATDPDADRLVLKSANQMVLTSTFLVTKSELSLLNTFLKLTKQPVHFLQMLPSVNQSYQLSW